MPHSLSINTAVRQTALLFLFPIIRTHFGLHFAGGSIGTLRVSENFSHSTNKNTVV